jgi:UDP-N-acetylglucosamine transferase subunit ALG13
MGIVGELLPERNMLRTAHMIFVTVGNATQGFQRLLRAVDNLAGNSLLKGENVIMQSGNADFCAANCIQRDFFPPDEYKELIAQADVVICHGGAGTLHHVFQTGKLPVVMPRRKQYGEHLDDQFQLVTAVAAAGRVIPAYEAADLPRAILEARHRRPPTMPSRPENAIKLVTVAIQELCTFQA